MIKKKEGARMTTLRNLIFSPWLKMIKTLTDSYGLNGCAIPELVTGNNSMKKTILVSHQTILVDFMKKEVLK